MREMRAPEGCPVLFKSRNCQSRERDASGFSRLCAMKREFCSRLPLERGAGAPRRLEKRATERTFH